MKAEIKEYMGSLRIFVDGEPIISNAYITYFNHN